MRTNIIITDDFYEDPYEVRRFALSQEFKTKGNFPGARTVPLFPESVKDSIQKIVFNAGGKITNFSDNGSNACFQTAYAWDNTWIHADSLDENAWAGVCYLTPNAPLSGGTATYQHKPSSTYFSKYKNIERPQEADEDGCDITKWDPVDNFGNRFNRLVLYRGCIYHSSKDYFGRSIDSCRLFQVFFFSTEY